MAYQSDSSQESLNQSLEVTADVHAEAYQPLRETVSACKLFSVMHVEAGGQQGFVRLSRKIVQTSF